MKYYKQIKTKIQCLLCPRKCILAEGQNGFCRSVFNNFGKADFRGYGYSSGFAIDPVEKKPLYHFYPSSKTFSFGTFGCNMGCTFCQNHHISKHNFDLSKSVKASPEQIVQTAMNYGCKSIAFTYNEPVIFMDYAIEIAKLARKNGLKTIAVTAGYILPEPAKEFFSYTDAANIDLKSFSEKFYKKFCFADISHVKNTLKLVAKETDCILEITTLLIENENTNSDELKREFDWIAENLGTDIPLHLSAFHPDYKMTDKARTSEQIILNAVHTAKNSGLNYVYCGNIPNLETSITACPKCGYKLIIRNGYNTVITGMNANKCSNCGHKIYGAF